MAVVEKKDVHDSNGIVVEDGRDVFGGEFVGRIADEKTCLADSTVTGDNTLDGTFTSVFACLLEAAIHWRQGEIIRKHTFSDCTPGAAMAGKLGIDRSKRFASVGLTGRW